MKVYLFYRPESGSDVQIEVFLKLLGDRRRQQIKMININTREGSALSQLYDVMSYPSVVVCMEDGQQVKFWHGSLPATEDVAFYLTG